MNREFLSKVVWQAHYCLKEGTSTSFVYAPFMPIENITDKKAKAAAIAELIEQNRAAEFPMLLPFRISFINPDTASVANTGRGTRKKVKQMKATFTKCEESPYKLAYPYKVCTSIWQVDNTKCLFFGTIGINKEKDAKPLDNGDLVVFHTADWRRVEVFIFKGLAKPNNYASTGDAIEYVKRLCLLG